MGEIPPMVCGESNMVDTVHTEKKKDVALNAHKKSNAVAYQRSNLYRLFDRALHGRVAIGPETNKEKRTKKYRQNLTLNAIFA